MSRRSHRTIAATAVIVAACLVAFAYPVAATGSPSSSVAQTVDGGEPTGETARAALAVQDDAVTIASPESDTRVDEGDEVTFTAETSDDVESVQWDIDGDGEHELAGETVTHTYDVGEECECTITATGTDADGTAYSDSVVLHFNQQPPDDGTDDETDDSGGSDGGDADESETSDDGDGEDTIPGFGVGLALAAVVGAALLAARRN